MGIIFVSSINLWCSLVLNLYGGQEKMKNFNFEDLRSFAQMQHFVTRHRLHVEQIAVQNYDKQAYVNNRQHDNSEVLFSSTFPFLGILNIT
jgi:hypothetical protein